MRFIFLLLFLLTFPILYCDLAPPSNHVTNFTATVDASYNIDLEWVHNDGVLEAEGYYIVARKSFPPTNSDAPAYNNYYEDHLQITINSGNVTVVQAKEPATRTTYEWTGQSNGTYYFDIYPYRTEDEEISYKIDESVPSASAVIDNPLPVILSTFTVSFNMSLPIINWTTQSEQNNQGWNVYRSISDELSSSIQINEPFLIPGAGTTTTPTDYSFNDTYTVEENTTYWYWLESVSFSGFSKIHGPVYLTIPSSEPGHNNPATPIQYGLLQNFPNPFNPNTEIRFRLKEDSRINLLIFDVKGKKVKTILQNQFILKDNIVRAVWNGTDQYNRQVASGVYFACLVNGSEIITRRMLMIK
ncbi:MAG: hypothetical protein DRH79_05335 [Candidatus Cloacimonadota bacterium]|nr:MAG: hypothetical protein DRH79_05335 [Candidatus Cloacimonadota bacterium]